ncbi:MAG: SPOR domain-containing protein [Bacteroidota bacterium]
MQKLIILVLTLCLLPMGCSKKTTTTGEGGEASADWKSQAREYVRNPDALRNLVETSEANEQRANQLDREVNGLRTSSATAASNLQQAQSDLANLRTQLTNAEQRATAAEAALAIANQPNEMDTDAVVDGIIFQVQLGAFAQPDNQMDQELQTGDGLELQDQNGLQKVVVSQFRSYDSARRLRDRLRQMGVSDAFVVAKRDGVRINIQEALEATGQQ